MLFSSHSHWWAKWLNWLARPSRKREIPGSIPRNCNVFIFFFSPLFDLCILKVSLQTFFSVISKESSTCKNLPSLKILSFSMKFPKIMLLALETRNWACFLYSFNFLKGLEAVLEAAGEKITKILHFRGIESRISRLRDRRVNQLSHMAHLWKFELKSIIYLAARSTW